MPQPSRKAARFTESVIRGMTRLAKAHGAVNLAQGFPDFPTPEAVKEAACQAIRDEFNQYSVTWGAPQLREAVARKMQDLYGIPAEADKHVTVCCGSTECMIATMLACVDPGDEVIAFEPFYENYGPDAILSGARLVLVPLEGPQWRFDPDRLAAAIGPKTRAIIVNTPHNPTGKVFSRQELQQIADLCLRHDLLAFTDEIYEHIIYDGREHVAMASLEGMFERTVTISGLSKTFSITGWRLAYCVAPEVLTRAIRKVHDFLTVGAPHPLQVAGAAALEMGEPYYRQLALDYAERRAALVPALQEVGFICRPPEGAYYVMCGLDNFEHEDDVAFARWMTEKVGVAPVPASSFFDPPEKGRHIIRFAYCKKLETLANAVKRLKGLDTLRRA